MPLQLEENIKPLPVDFKWGAEWTAIRMWKELRDDGEFLYAFLVRRYGPDDYGRKREDELWIGREIEYIKERDWQRDPKKPNFGQRVDIEPDEVVESIWDEAKGKYIEQKTPLNARKRYKYVHRADNKEIVKRYQSLIQMTGVVRTKLYFVYNDGSRIISIENEDEFFNTPVKQVADMERKSYSIFNTAKDRQRKGTSTSDDQTLI
jgi:hypothetical protein